MGSPLLECLLFLQVLRVSIGKYEWYSVLIYGLNNGTGVLHTICTGLEYMTFNSILCSHGRSNRQVGSTSLHCLSPTEILSTCPNFQNIMYISMSLPYFETGDNLGVYTHTLKHFFVSSLRWSPFNLKKLWIHKHKTDREIPVRIATRKPTTWLNCNDRIHQVQTFQASKIK